MAAATHSNHNSACSSAGGDGILGPRASVHGGDGGSARADCLQIETEVSRKSALVRKNFKNNRRSRCVTRSSTAEDPAIPKLTAAGRYLEEQLSANGVDNLPSKECLKEFALDAIDATDRTRRRGESYISCLCRDLDARVRFIILWTTTNEAFEEAMWRDLVEIARKHAVLRT